MLNRICGVDRGKGLSQEERRSSCLVAGLRAGFKRKSRGLHGVREAVRKDSTLKFTALLHHVNEDCLTESVLQLEEDGGSRSRRSDLA